MAEHRAKSLSALLQIALATGFSEIDPELEPLKVLYSSMCGLLSLTKFLGFRLWFHHGKR
jgi:hypothetical protein